MQRSASERPSRWPRSSGLAATLVFGPAFNRYRAWPSGPVSSRWRYPGAGPSSSLEEMGSTASAARTLARWRAAARSASARRAVQPAPGSRSDQRRDGPDRGRVVHACWRCSSMPVIMADSAQSAGTGICRLVRGANSGFWPGPTLPSAEFEQVGWDVLRPPVGVAVVPEALDLIFLPKVGTSEDGLWTACGPLRSRGG